jgi:malate permease and related proteins
MNAFLATFQAVAALLGIGIVGFWVIGRRNLPATALNLLTSIAIDITLPCLVLGNLITQFTPQDYPSWWHYPLWLLGFEILALGLSLLGSLLVNRQYRSEFSISLFLQNAIFFPLIIIGGLFPSQTTTYLVPLFLFTFIQPTIAFAGYPYFFRGKGQNTTFSWQRVLNPVLIITIIGIGFGLAGISRYVPSFLVMILTLIGAMSVPLFMLILGGNVYNDFKQGAVENGGKRFYVKEILLFLLCKNILFPAVFLPLLIWLKPEYPLAFILILQASVPPITAIPVFAQRSGGNRAIASQLIVASFLASIFTIPLVIFIFSRYFPFPA